MASISFNDNLDLKKMLPCLTDWSGALQRRVLDLLDNSFLQV
jgi:hypothetical protein